MDIHRAEEFANVFSLVKLSKDLPSEMISLSL